MPIRFRIRGPGGLTALEAQDDWTVAQLLELVKEKTGYEQFTLKYGWPPRDLLTEDAGIVSLGPLKLNGETLLVQPVTILSEETASRSAPTKDVASTIARDTAAASQPEPLPATQAVDETTAEWPERGGSLVLRVMPDDNSCLFTAFGGAVKIDDPSVKLRRQIADYIESHPEQYTKAILDNLEPARYIARILQPDTWGGAIELDVLSRLYDIQICSIDVKSLRIDKFGEDKPSRCVIVYSGIHYDRIAFVPDMLGANADAAFDETRWEVDDDAVLEKAQQLVRKLQQMHYYTDSSDFVVRCNVCNWIGQGQSQVSAHQKQTGHGEFEEMKID